MKRFLLLLSFAICFENVAVYGQITQPALTPETQFPDVSGTFDNSSAYSSGNLIIPGSPTPVDLYVFTWDNFSSGGSGMSIREGATYYDESAVFPNNATSVEAVILKNSFSGPGTIKFRRYHSANKPKISDSYCFKATPRGKLFPKSLDGTAAARSF